MVMSDQPYVGTPEQRNLCQQGVTCTESASSGPLTNLSDAQLDFYSCLNELDSAVGRVLDALDKRGYGKNTLTWLGKKSLLNTASHLPFGTGPGGRLNSQCAPVCAIVAVQRPTMGPKKTVHQKASVPRIITEWVPVQQCHCVVANETSGNPPEHISICLRLLSFYIWRMPLGVCVQL